MKKSFIFLAIAILSLALTLTACVATTSGETEMPVANEMCIVGYEEPIEYEKAEQSARIALDAYRLTQDPGDVFTTLVDGLEVRVSLTETYGEFFVTVQLHSFVFSYEGEVIGYGCHNPRPILG